MGKIGAVVRNRQAQAKRRRRQAAEFLALLQRPCPELRHVAHGRVAASVDGHEGADLQTACGIDRRSAAKTTLEVSRLGTKPGTGIAKREVPRCAAGRVVGKVAIRRPVPALVAAIQQVEQDGRRHDGHHDVRDGQTAATLAQPAHHTVGRGEPIGGAAGKADRIDPVDHTRGIEQISFAGARRTTPDIDRRHCRRLAENDADARAKPLILGIADKDTVDVGDQVARAVAQHRISRAAEPSP